MQPKSTVLRKLCALKRPTWLPALRRFKSVACVPILAFALTCCLPASAQSLELEWASNFLGKEVGVGVAVCFDSLGNIYMAGTFNDTMDVDPGPDTVLLIPQALTGGPVLQTIFFAKYDSNGNYLWSKALQGRDVRFYGTARGNMVIDKSGNLIIAGSIHDDSVDFDPGPGSAVRSAADRNIFIAKYDNDGNYLWVKHTPGTGEWPGGLDVDTAGNIYLAGTFSQTVDYDLEAGLYPLTPAGGQDNYVAKYDKDGRLIWAHRMGGTGNLAENGNGITVDPWGNVISTGAFADTATFSSSTSTLTAVGGRDAYIMKQDTAGNLLWVIGLGSPADDYGYEVHTDEAGNVYAAGYFSGSVDFDPGPDTAMLTSTGGFHAFLAKYDTAGSYLWAIDVGGGFLTSFIDVKTDRIGNVYAAGFFMGTVDFDPGPDTVELAAPSPFTLNACLAKYEASTGDYLWAGSIESSVSSYVSGIGVTADGTVLATGNYLGLADLDPGQGTAHYTADGTNAFLIKLACDARSFEPVTVTECGTSYWFNGTQYTSSGTFIQHYSNEFHCDSAVVLHLDLLPPLAAPVITVDAFVLGTTLNYASYQWIKDGIPLPGETAPTLTVTENADYQVRVVSEDGCEALSEVYRVSNVRVDELGDVKAQITAYPNPATTTVRVKSPFPVNLELLTLEGRQIRYRADVYEIELEGLAEGVYLLRISDKQNRILKYEKVVKR